MAVSGPRAMKSHEPGQVREEAAVSGPFHVTRCILEAVINEDCKASVSYTHLTLPTTVLV